MRFGTFRTLFVLATSVALFAIACSSDPEPAAPADTAGISDSVEVTQPDNSADDDTSMMDAAPTPTNLPEPTATSVPAPFVDPLRNPDVESLVVRELPSDLIAEQVITPPSEDRVVELWTEFFTNSYFDLTGSGQFYHQCSDGVSVAPNPNDSPFIVSDTPEAWYIDSPSAAAPADWWEARYLAKPAGGGGRYLSLASLDVLNGQATTTFQSTEQPLIVYESEYCKIR